jgi:hypothetical protein
VTLSTGILASKWIASATTTLAPEIAPQSLHRGAITPLKIIVDCDRFFHVSRNISFCHPPKLWTLDVKFLASRIFG